MSYDSEQLDTEIDLARLVKLLNLTGSNQTGEVLNAIAAANRLVTQAGSAWQDIVRPADAERYQSLLHDYRYQRVELAEARRDIQQFIHAVAGQPQPLNDRQRDLLS